MNPDVAACAEADRAGVLEWAQVAERLMAADCKSAAPCELRRFESSPVHQKYREQGTVDASRWEMGVGLENANHSGDEFDRKFWVAMAMYAVLAVLAWFTIGEGSFLVGDRPVEIRLVPLIVMGGLALKTVLARHAEKIRREKDSI